MKKIIKRDYLKGWVQTALEVIAVMSFFLMGFDSMDALIFNVGHLILIGVLISTTLVLSKYGRYND